MLGRGLHYVDGKNGVKDFDVWTFFAAHPDHPDYPWRRRKAVDFGDPKFGRSLQVDEDADPAVFLREYLAEGRTETARRLAEKAVVLLEPPD